VIRAKYFNPDDAVANAAASDSTKFCKNQRENFSWSVFNESAEKIILVAEVATRVGVVHHVRVLGSPDGLNALIEQRTTSKI
jgi:hypothetical protein